MSKSLGNKRNELSDEHIQQITKLYGSFKENENCKIFDNTDFGYNKVTVERPERDAKGNITLLAKLDENEVYGNLEAGAVQQWGVPVSTVIKEQPRALWTPHPPVWMLVTFFVLMVVVWGHFFVIVYQLWRLRKEEPHGPTTIINS